MTFVAKKNIVIAGHRGNPAAFPENTMDSFRSAVELGVDMVETDIHVSRDGKLVLIHDHEVDRTTDGTGLVREKTFEELEALNAGTAERPAKIPTLREFLEYCAGVPGLFLNLEMKVYLDDEGPERVAYAVDETVKLCEELGLSKRILFNSFDAYVLEYIYRTYRRKYLLHGYYPYDIMSHVELDPAEYLDYASYWSSGEGAKRKCGELKALGIEPCTGSNTKEADFYEAASYGCGMFTENDPKSALAWREFL